MKSWWAWGPGAAALCLVAMMLAGGSTPAALPAPVLPEELLDAQRAATDERERWSRERLEQWHNALDEGEEAEHTHRIRQAHMDDGSAAIPAIFLQGEALFEHRFSAREGLGHTSRVQHAENAGGPDATSCRECHGRGGDDGHGEQHHRAWLDGDGHHLASASPRIAPHLAGLGPIQVLARQMTRELRAARDLWLSQERPLAPLRLWAAGVEFGELRMRQDGSLDATGVHGVDADLVIKPFGWKGTHATLRSFIRSAFPGHMGLEPLPLDEAAPLQPVDPLRPSTLRIPEAQSWKSDGDGDGVAGELTEGQLTSMVVYLSLLDVPVILPPRRAETMAAFARGRALLDETGCTGCHVPALALKGTEWTEQAPTDGKPLALDVIKDSQVPPVLDASDYSAPGVMVPLFSDLRRHDMGPALAERLNRGVGESVFLTRPLWGIGDRGPGYLHDGRARTFREAILLHGGEADAAARAYERLSSADARAIEVFLLGLRRVPQVRLFP